MIATNSFLLDVNEDISLTEIRPVDSASFVELLNDADIYAATLRIPYPYSPADAETFLAIVEDDLRKHGRPAIFAVRERSGKLIGVCGFEGLVYGHRAEIGYWLGKPYWNRGIMTGVVRSLCAFAVERWKLVRITAHVFDGNAASARVLEKCGFQFEGLLRKHHLKAGRFIDSRLFALVK